MQPGECSVLVVDDDHEILATVSDILSGEGYPVATAHNGLEALEQVERARPHVVLLDMRMPVLDGWGFARRVRERGLRLEIVVMTAAQDARRWAREIQADGVIAKPFDVSELLAALAQHCPQSECQAVLASCDVSVNAAWAAGLPSARVRG